VSGGGRTLLDGLADCLPADAVEAQEFDGGSRLWLPQPVGADYRFYINTYDGGGAFIGALPNGAPERTFFWHLPLEYPAEGQDAGLTCLIGEAKRLIRNRSRIIQTAGLLLWRFRCEVEEGGSWRRVGGIIANLRFFFLPPLPFQFKRWEFHSDPLGSPSEGGRPTSGCS